MLISNLRHDHNFDYDKWENNFKNNFSPRLSLSHSSSNDPSLPNTQYPNPPPYPNLLLLGHIPPTSHLVDEFRILNIPVTSTFRKISIIIKIIIY